MSKVITLDLGPTFTGLAIEVAGELVCVLPPTILEDSAKRDRIREMMGTQGTDCTKCRGCQVGAARNLSS
ncbi:hypothetical protein [Streptomyces goshikiensis]|uniref:hypothetical protein n=1 Tax=Streptomyces goshikiensis TaxID=1942 RepID=UPI002E122B5F|nr:hypothetical protein OG224_06955 [Streptomyces goshikiensis]